MIGEFINEKFIVTPERYNESTHLDKNSILAAGGKDIDTLFKSTVILDGLVNKSFPISTMLFGKDMLNGGGTKIEGYRYKYPVVTRPSSLVHIAKTPASTTMLGASGKDFILAFNKRVHANWVYMTQGHFQVHVAKVEKQGDIWVATCRLLNKTAILPASQVQANMPFVPVFTAVSVERSRGAEYTTSMPGEIQNQIGIMRLSMSWGDVDNLSKVMKYQIAGGKGETTWASMWLHTFNVKWAQMLENVFWYSRYNRDSNSSKIELSDAFTDEEIPMGAGLLEQIPNINTYSILTFNKLEKIFSDLTFKNADMSENGYTIELHTGRLGIREFDRVVREKGLDIIQDFGNVSDKFIKGEGQKLQLTGHFNSFTTIDGITVKVVHNPVFDYGTVAEVSRRHPKYPRYSIESGRMVFLDNSTRNGESNIRFVTPTPTGNSGNAYHWTVLGGTDAPPDLRGNYGSVTDGKPPQRSSETNVGGYHRAMKGGVQIIDPSSCINIECVAS